MRTNLALQFHACEFASFGALVKHHKQLEKVDMNVVQNYLSMCDFIH